LSSSEVGADGIDVREEGGDELARLRTPSAALNRKTIHRKNIIL
jgi:hypothetical protein